MTRTNERNIVTRWIRSSLSRLDDAARRAENAQPAVNTGDARAATLVFPASHRCGGGRRIIRKKIGGE